MRTDDLADVPKRRIGDDSRRGRQIRDDQRSADLRGVYYRRVEDGLLVEQGMQVRKIALTQDAMPAGNRMIVIQAHGPQA